MTQKTYNVWNTENIYQAPAVRNIQTDFWSTLQSAVLTWNVSGTAGFDNIVFNGSIVGTSANGSADVKQYLRNGQNNNVTLNYRCSWETNILGQAAGNARVYLTINGYMATYEILLSQNKVFLDTYRNGQSTLANYQQAIAFQNSIAQQMLALGLLTAGQYEALISAQNPTSDGSTGGIGGNGNTNTGGWGNNGNTTVQTGGFNMLNLAVILAGVVLLALGCWYAKRSGYI